jgi:hypothetical protein
MKLVRNAGNDRVIDLVRSSLRSGRRIDVMSPALSLFAFAELLPQLAAAVRCRFVLPPSGKDLDIIGSAADRSSRNQRQWVEYMVARTVEDVLTHV